MPDPTTTNRGFTIPNNGADVGTWDVPVNGNMNLLDTMLGAVAAVALSSQNVTLSASSYQRGVIQFTGTLVANVTVTFPTVSGWWTIENDTTSTSTSPAAYVVQLTCGAGRVICAPPGGYDVYMDGTNANYRNLPPVGSYTDYAGTAVPAWWSNCTVPPYLNCDGTTFNAATYPMLNQILGGNTLPDSKGRTRFNLNQGSGRIVNNLNGNVIFSGGGSELNILTQANLPNVSYNLSGGGTFVTGLNQVTNALANNALGAAVPFVETLSANFGSVGGSIGPLGSATAFSNTPPGYVGGITMIRAA